MSVFLLQRLRDVQGVIGSFTCGAVGELSFCDMPEGFSRAALETTASRLGNLFQTADEALSESHGIYLCFAEHQLHARRFAGGLLCVLTGPHPDRGELHASIRSVLGNLPG